MEAVVERALAAAKRCGASQVDAVLVESDDREVRVRGDEIEFVKQAQERGLGIRALVGHRLGRSFVAHVGRLGAVRASVRVTPHHRVGFFRPVVVPFPPVLCTSPVPTYVRD